MHIISPEHLATYLRDSRKQLGLSQAEIADRVGLKQSTVSSFENTPSGTKCETIFKILSALALELHVRQKKSDHVDKAEWSEQW